MSWGDQNLRSAEEEEGGIKRKRGRLIEELLKEDKLHVKRERK